MVNVFYPPLNTPMNNGTFKIFLAGSIEMNKCIDWQKDVENIIVKDISNANIDIYNPRRDYFGFAQGSNEFNEQVNWELDHLEKCDMIIMVLLNDTISPISLLELGLFANSKKMIVICGDEYFRKHNVKIVCERHGIKYFESLTDGIDYCKELIIKKSL